MNTDYETSNDAALRRGINVIRTVPIFLKQLGK